jgi:hypothetical protein
VATQQELEASAGKHARATSWSWDRYLAEIRKNPNYKYQGTEWYKAGLDLEKTKSSSPPSPTTPPPASSLAQMSLRMIFCAQRSEAALAAPHGMPVALTADPSYAQWATPAIVADFRAQGRKVYSWGVQTQIPPSAITGLRDRLGLDGAIGQGETADEYTTAMQAGFGIIVANPNSWSDAQRADANRRIAKGELAVIGECYTNLGGPWPKDYSAGGVNVSSLCLGVYDGTREQPGSGWNPSVAAYKANTPPAIFATAGVYHAAGVDPSEWGLFA